MVSKSGLALEALLRGPDDLLLLDEPDNSLDVPGKRWLEEQLRATDKGVLYVSHDRELLARTATSIITLELDAAGNTAWTHPGGFDTYHRAREQRFEPSPFHIAQPISCYLIKASRDSDALNRNSAYADTPN